MEPAPEERPSDDASERGHARDESLPKTHRLLKRSTFLRIQRFGGKRVSRFFVVLSTANEVGHARLGITVSRRVGPAHERNRLRRWTRELYRRNADRIEAVGDLVIIMRQGAASLSHETFDVELRRLLFKRG